MAHLPINHRLGRFYRFLAAAAGLYVLLFGIIGAARTWGGELFDRGDATAFGLRTNLAFSLLSIVAGGIVVLGALIGRNIDHFVNYLAGGLFWVAGLAMLVLLQTKANLLNFQVSTCIVSFILGTLFVLAGLYGKRGSPEAAEAEEAFRHSTRSPQVTSHLATPHHELSAHPGVKHPQL